MEVSGQLHVPAALLPGYEPPQYSLDGRLVGPQCRLGSCREEKNLTPVGISTQPSNPQPVAVHNSFKLHETDSADSNSDTRNALMLPVRKQKIRQTYL
jgi:hypothetical protein